MEEREEESQDLLDNDLPEVPSVGNLPISMPGIGSDAQYTTPPLKIDNAPNELFNKDPLGSLLSPDETMPQSAFLPKTKDKPGLFETVGHNLKQMNTGILAGEYAYNEFFRKNPLNDVVPEEGYTAMKPESVEGFDNKYWPFLTSAKSPNDLAARQTHVRQQMAEDEKFSNGSLFPTLLGGLLGVLTDPTTYLIPMASAGKYAKLSQNVIKNMTKIAPGMAIDSMARNTMVQANRAGGNIQDMATDSLRDFVFGTALIGSGSALGSAKRAGTLWNTRRAFNFAADGVLINPVVKDGIIVKEMAASLVPGEIPTAQNALYVGAANNYVEEIANSGVFGKQFLGDAVKNILGSDLVGTPVMQAARSPYKQVQSFFNRTAFTGAITERTLDGASRAFTAHEYATFYRDHARDVAGTVRELFYKANGIGGATETGKALKNFKQAYTQNRTITEEAFGKEIRSILNTKGYESAYPEAKEAADITHNFFKGMGEDIFKSMGKEGTFLDPVTAWKYLPQNYNIPAMINRPQEWVDITVEQYQKQDDLIHSLTKPVKDTEARIGAQKIRLSEIGEAGKTSLTYKAARSELAKEKRLLTQQLDEQVGTIRNNSEYHILLEDRVMFDSGEVKELESILEPVSVAEKDVSKVKREVTRSFPKRDLAEDKLTASEKELKKTKKAFRKSTDKTANAFYEAKIAENESEIAELRFKRDEASESLRDSEGRLSKATDRLDKAKDKIQNDFYEGRIDKKFI